LNEIEVTILDFFFFQACCNALSNAFSSNALLELS